MPDELCNHGRPRSICAVCAPEAERRYLEKQQHGSVVSVVPPNIAPPPRPRREVAPPGSPFRVPAGTWEHYKGPLYNVLGVARHHEHGALHVVYHPILPHGPDAPAWNVRRVWGVRKISGMTKAEWLGDLAARGVQQPALGQLLSAAFDEDGWMDPVDVPLKPGTQQTSDRFFFRHPVVNNPDIKWPVDR